MAFPSDLVVTIPRLVTPRLVLRAFRPNDFADYEANMNDPEATKYTSRPASGDRTMWWSFAAQTAGWVLGGAGWWAVEHRETAQTVGMVGVFIRDSAPDDYEIGWSIYRAFWRQGYAAEAARAALDYAFVGHHAPRVVAHIDGANDASIAVSKKLGMTYEKDIDFYGKPIGRYLVSRPNTD